LNRIDSADEAKAIEMWFLGYTRDEIARALGIGQGTVSTIIGSLPPCLQQLRELARILRKRNMTPSDALAGAKLQGLLAEYSVSPEQIVIFLETVRKASKEARVQPQEAVQASIRIASLENQAGAPYPEALKKFEMLTQQISECKKKRSKLLLETKESKRLCREAFEEAKMVPQQLSEFVDCKAALHEYGMDISDPIAVRKALDNLKEADGDPKRLISLMEKYGSIAKLVAHLERTLPKKQDDLANLQSQIEKYPLIVWQLENEVKQLKYIINSQKETIYRNNYQLNLILANIAELEKRRQALITWIGKQLNLSQSEIDSLRLNSQFEIVLASIDNELRDAQARVLRSLQ
jgi:chromosome segregation ATPase